MCVISLFGKGMKLEVNESKFHKTFSQLFKHACFISYFQYLFSSVFQGTGDSPSKSMVCPLWHSIGVLYFIKFTNQN